MPTTLKRRIPTRKADPSRLTPAQIEHLIQGRVWWATAGTLRPSQPPFESDAQRREIWFRYREDLMARRETVSNLWNWGNEVYPAGTRPSAWWDYEAPERRPMIRKGEKGKGRPCPDSDPQQFYIMGLPQLFFDNYGVTYPPFWEPQWRYLRRLRLLDRGELEEATKLARLKFDRSKRSQYPPMEPPQSIEDLLDEFLTL